MARQNATCRKQLLEHSKARHAATGRARAHRAGVQLTQVLEARADLQDVGVMRQVVLAVGCRHPHPPMRNQSRSKAMAI